MQTLKVVYNWLEGIFGAFWIASILDYFSILNVLQFTFQETFNSMLNSLFIAFGLVFFILGGWYKHSIKQEEIKSKKIANKKAQLELDRLEQSRKKN